ncbi:helix-turn-helix transcriptional regulator [Saccharopolyspora sp. NFXS83]|uniref:helix-turn-helix domain-containing protein n=1 Tax=Saccharopolyspora sp. NFXS83 TaxID=2993560 RepID=UPI00224ACB1A|nr:helix-turn-helix transcriptional regulator [Saccharopolyspora sp. NFXS83]MCX2731988.1 helix-turn-helix transcriptional regulator [Saccharopolyspora sp. NFXS83]
MVGTTPKTQAIGVALRRAREDAGLSARQLATKLAKSHTTIGRWESGERAPRPVDVATVLSALGADNSLREELVELARNADGRQWSSSGLPEQQRQLTTLLEIERTAHRIVSVSPLLVPGLLQTADYARAMMFTAGIPANEVELRVAVRIGRRDVIAKEKPAHLVAITSESALRALIGGEEVMSAQLRSLVSHATWSNVDLRVVPTGTGWHPGLEGPFSVFEYAGKSVVHVENRVSGQFFHELADVTAYADAIATITDVALSQEESARLIAEILDEQEETS